MSNKQNLKPHEVISLKEAELVAQIKLMSVEELEFHAQEIMKDLGENNYPSVMSEVIQKLQEDLPEGYNKFEFIQKTLEDKLPNKAYLSDIYARLAAIVMSIIARKFQALL